MSFFACSSKDENEDTLIEDLAVLMRAKIRTDMEFDYVLHKEKLENHLKYYTKRKDKRKIEIVRKEIEQLDEIIKSVNTYKAFKTLNEDLKKLSEEWNKYNENVKDTCVLIYILCLS